MLQLLDTLLFQFVLIIVVLWKFKSFVLSPTRSEIVFVGHNEIHVYYHYRQEKEVCVFCIENMGFICNGFAGVFSHESLYAKETVPYQIQVLNVFLWFAKITIIQLL